MRNWMLSAAAAALVTVTTNAGPAAAQEPVSGSSWVSPGYFTAPTYYGGYYAPAYRGAYSSGSRSFSSNSYSSNSYSGISRGASYGGPPRYYSGSGVSYGARSFDGRRR